MTDDNYKQKITDFENEVEDRGFRLDFLDRGINYKGTYYSDRFEFWLEGHWFNSKITFARTIEELCENGFSEVRARMDKDEPGRFNDK